MLASICSYFKSVDLVTDVEVKTELIQLFNKELDEINLEVLIVNEKERPQREIIIRNVFGNLAKRFITHQPDLTFGMLDNNRNLIDVFIIDDFGNGVAIVTK